MVVEWAGRRRQASSLPGGASTNGQGRSNMLKQAPSAAAAAWPVSRLVAVDWLSTRPAGKPQEAAGKLQEAAGSLGGADAPAVGGGVRGKPFGLKLVLEEEEEEEGQGRGNNSR